MPRNQVLLQRLWSRSEQYEVNSMTQLQVHTSSAHPNTSNPRRCPHHETPSTLSATIRTAPKKSRSEHQDIDPMQPEPHMLPTGEDELSQAIRELYQQHWSAIRTHHLIGQRVQDMYNYHIEDLNMHSLTEQLQQMFRNQTSRFKVNASFGFIMQHVETGELRYYHTSHNHGCILEAPHLISGQGDFDGFLKEIIQEDVLEWARQQQQDKQVDRGIWYQYYPLSTRFLIT